MITFSRALLCELEEELHAISFNYDNPISMSDKSIETIVKYLQILKNYILDNEFPIKEDEIHFFKYIKPKFSSKLIYFNKVRKLESYKPLGSKRIQRDYLDNELNKLNIYFSENTEFYNYYRLGGQSFDNKIFIRHSVEIDYNLDIFYHELDHRFSTTHDFKVAMILANEIFQRYIENKIKSLSNSKSVVIKNPLENKVFKWTASKTDLIELIYALHTQKVFNDGKADLTEISKCFEKLFDIELGDIYRACNEIKNRKINKTKFIDTLSENLNKRFDEKDNK
ncbi:RteC domain-containing protein [Flavobacterium sp. W20_MBD1_R3]|uniref:RteC domain-containing protein n=1 Tax=Flavobacterium sp. W20_MBD1_R3 TaxID=3240278 RepID=UPI003F93E292